MKQTNKQTISTFSSSRSWSVTGGAFCFLLPVYSHTITHRAQTNEQTQQTTRKHKQTTYLSSLCLSLNLRKNDNHYTTNTIQTSRNTNTTNTTNTNTYNTSKTFFPVCFAFCSSFRFSTVWQMFLFYFICLCACVCVVRVCVCNNKQQSTHFFRIFVVLLHDSVFWYPLVPSAHAQQTQHTHTTHAWQQRQLVRKTKDLHTLDSIDRNAQNTAVLRGPWHSLSVSTQTIEQQ